MLITLAVILNKLFYYIGMALRRTVIAVLITKLFGKN